MKTFFAFSLILITLFSSAQIKTATFNGKTYKVFPYRVQRVENSYNSDFENGSDLAVPYCPEKLENGEYLIYYKPSIRFIKLGKSNFMTGDTFEVFSVFSINNGIKDGAVCFYWRYKLSKPFAFGFYKDDMKSGVWKINGLYGKSILEFKNGLLNGKSEFVKKTGEKKIRYYKDGVQHGIEENYKDNKLVYSETYKEGKKYGPFQRNFKIDDIKFRVEGFHLSYYRDSFINTYKNNKLIESCLNSRVPFAGQDTSYSDWYIATNRFDLGLPNKFFNSAEVSSYDTYTYFYSINDQGIKYNEIYINQNQIKVPFFILSNHGDTIKKVKRIEKTPEYYKYLITSKSYDKNGKLERESQFIETCFIRMEDDIIKNEYLISDSYTLKYLKNSTEKHFKFRHPIEKWKGWVIKTDSTVWVNSKTQKLEDVICEEFVITGQTNRSFLIFRNIKTNDTIDWENYGLKFITDDTLAVTETNEIIDDLKIHSVTKICLKDSSETIQGEEDLIDPGDIINSYDIGSYIGTCAPMVTYKGIPYTGSLWINEKYNKRLKEFDSEQKLEVLGNDLLIIKVDVPKERTLRKIFKKTGLFLIRRSHKFETYPSPNEQLISCQFNFKNGKLHGLQEARGYQNEVMYSLNFKDGVTHGTQNFNEYISDVRLKMENDLLNQYYYEVGKLHGYVTKVNKRRQTTFLAEYNHGKLNGAYAEFEEDLDNPYNIPSNSLLAKFSNDTVMGEVKVFKDGYEIERIPFVKGKATGNYYRNNRRLVTSDESDSAHDYSYYHIDYNELKIKLDDGVIQDTVFAYFYDGRIKYIAVIDTDFRQRYIFQLSDSDEIIPQINKQADKFKDSILDYATYHNYSASYNHKSSAIYFALDIYNEGIDLDALYDYTKAHFTFYYKNGVKSQEGKMINNKKYGVWKYWSENGVLMKEIDYKPGRDSSLKNMIYRGKIKGYYPNGQKMMEGIITDEEFSYECSQEVSVSYQEVYYTRFLDEKGNEILNNGTCPVMDFHLNGSKYFAGQITNGQRTGLWKFYDPTGNLKALGEYADGEKQGRWLSGDLGGINFVDNACSITEVLSLIKERQIKDIDITESLYEMGKEISKSHLVLEKF